MALCQPQVYREAFIIASLRPFFGNFLVSYTEQNLFWISIIPEEFCQTALDIVQRKVTIKPVDDGADVVGFDVVAVDEKIHYKDSMPPWGRLGWRYTYTSARPADYFKQSLKNLFLYRNAPRIDDLMLMT